jgi:hypothetical protein
VGASGSRRLRICGSRLGDSGLTQGTSMRIPPNKKRLGIKSNLNPVKLDRLENAPRCRLS